MSGRRRSRTTQSQDSFCIFSRACCAGFRSNNVNVVVTKQGGNAQPFRVVVFHNQQTFSMRLRVSLDSRQRRVKAFGCGWLVNEAKRPAGEAVLSIFVQRDDLYRDVSRQRILLEMTEHGPPQHVR